MMSSKFKLIAYYDTNYTSPFFGENWFTRSVLSPYKSMISLYNLLMERTWCSICYPANILHIQVQLFTFLQPHHKTETRIANRWGISNNKPHEPIIMMGPSETFFKKYFIFITFFFASAQCSTFLPSIANYHQIMLNQTLFLEKNQQVLHFLHVIILCRITYRTPLDMF